jgi:hypothetical protein
VLEVSYGLDKASPSKLSAPVLNKESPVPVQQTLWRLFVPAEDYVLRYDRTFSLLPPGQGQAMLHSLAAGQPTGLGFKLDRQGALWEFVRQGGPGELSVSTMGKEVFSILVWLIVLGMGLAMLRMPGMRRVLIVLGVALLLMIVNLMAPLLVGLVASVGIWGALIVAVLWLAQWVFIRLPRGRKEAATAGQPAGPPPLTPPAGGGPSEKPASPGLRPGDSKAKE